jgi:hypothetical protein
MCVQYLTLSIVLYFMFCIVWLILHPAVTVAEFWIQGMYLCMVVRMYVCMH